jgi:putative LysE/RhtB family amino acid efflux pump
MDLALFLKSAVLGLAIAAPLGPIGALCINRTLERGFMAGVAGGLGTAIADGLYAALAAFGFATFSAVLTGIDIPMRIAGGLFMLYLGWKTFSAKPRVAAATVSARDLVGTTTATFFLTITNPMTILSFTALFAGLGLASASGVSAALQVIAGVVLGSMLWWTLLSGGVALLRHRLPSAFAIWTSRVSAVIVLGFGLWAIGSVLLTWSVP